MSPKSPLVYLIFFLFLLLLPVNLLIDQKQHYIQLASSFLEGSFAVVIDNENISDFSYFNGQYFWPGGPLPAVLLMPFVFIFKNFFQSYIQFPLNLLNFFLIFKISRLFKIDSHKSLLLATFYIFGSIYTPVGALPGSWYFAQVIAVTCLAYALYEFLTKRRYFLIGTAIALATATRFTLIFSSLFFIIYLFKKPLNLAAIGKFSLPIIFVLAALGFYNSQRFGNFLESGYNYQLIYSESDQRRAYGLFSIRHIPANLYYMLLNGPQPVLKDNSHLLKPPYIKFDPYGLSIFFLSPVLLFIYRAKFNEKIVKVSLITIFLMLVPIVSYYGIGYVQIGYRYALDFSPFLFLILITAVKKIDLKFLYPAVLFGILVTWIFIFEMLFGFY